MTSLKILIVAAFSICIAAAGSQKIDETLKPCNYIKCLIGGPR